MVAESILRIDLASPEPAYEQIVNGLRGLLVSGGFQPGEQLPPVRQLALDLSLNHNTVAEAYRLLAKEGWLDLRQGRGAIVLARQSPKPSRASRSQWVRRLRELTNEAIANGLAKAEIAGELELLATAVRKGGGT